MAGMESGVAGAGAGRLQPLRTPSNEADWLRALEADEHAKERRQSAQHVN